MKAENLIPNGFQLRSFFLAKEHGKLKLMVCVCSDKQVAELDMLVQAFIESNKELKLSNEMIETFKRDHIKSLVRGDYFIPMFYSKAEEEQYFEYIATNLISQIISNQLHLIKQSMEKNDGLQPIHDTPKSEEKKTQTTKRTKRTEVN